MAAINTSTVVSTGETNRSNDNGPASVSVPLATGFHRHDGRGGERYDVPTLTEVFESSSDARLPPPCLLLMLMRLELRLDGPIIALMGRGMPAGDPGGEAMAANVDGRWIHGLRRPRM
jgi:hypothetical protein